MPTESESYSVGAKIAVCAETTARRESKEVKMRTFRD